LIARQFNPALRWPAALTGVLLGGVFSAYCVAPYIHPLNEALAGAVLGMVAALGFLWRIESEQVKVPRPSSAPAWSRCWPVP
jgi:predicted membrane protein